MSTPTYVTDCPNCGRQLAHHVGGWQGAPWVCASAHGGCGRAWWPAELAAEARVAWRPHHGDHAGGPDGHRFLAVLQIRCLEERARARERGTSALPECLATLTKAQLVTLVALVKPRAASLPAAAELLVAAENALAALTAVTMAHS